MTDKNIVGLSVAQVEEKLKTEGENLLEGRKKDGPFKIFFNQFKDLITIVLMAGALISLFLGERVDSIIIMGIIVMNAIMGFIQEYRTEKSLEALRALSAPVCSVIRSGEKRNIQAKNIVTEDIVSLKAGDRIPADCKVISAGEVKVNESVLSGESLPVSKRKGDLLYMSTGVTSGNCLAKVVAKGMNTKMGEIAGMMSSEDKETPLKKRMNKIGKLLVGISVAVCAIIALAGIYYGQSLSQVFFSAVSLAVAAIPEGLPAAVTLCLAIGVRKMLKRNALIRKLPAVETLGCTTIICTDKTGTLTQNKMTAVRFYAGGRALEKPQADSSDFEMLHRVGRLCLQEDTGEFGGDPTEMAIYKAAKRSGVSVEGYNRKGENPFTSERKAMSVMYEKDGKYYLVVKGAWDRIIKKCHRVLENGRERDMTPRLTELIEEEGSLMAHKALRVMAFAYKVSDLPFEMTEKSENNLVFVGLMGLMDPPRPETFLAIESCYRAGIRPIMITGDHKDTAVEIAKLVGIKIEGGGVITGEELEKMDEKQLQLKVCTTSVFARVSPEHKLKIVKALRHMGHIVSMTGDGVNDAPALKEADNGIAMGKSGTDVAKEAATVILMDDNFATIVAAVEEGRIIYNNIRKFIRYLLACNLGEILLMGCAAFMGLPVPMLPIQILWVNLITDGLPALALGMCSPPAGKRENIMSMPPRNPKESIFAGGLGGSIVFSGLIIGSSALIAFVAGYRVWQDIYAARTACFMVMIMAELMFAFGCRNERGEHIKVFGNKFLCMATGTSFILMLAVIYIPEVAGLFSVVPVKGRLLVIVVVLSLVESIVRLLVQGDKKGLRVIKKRKRA